MQKLLNNKGSLTVETAILFPVLMVVLLFGYVGVGFYVQYYKVQQCFYDTAEVLSDYAYVYHEKAISKVTAEWRSGLEETLDTALDTFQMDIPEELQGLFDVKTYIKSYTNGLLDQAESQLYVPIAHAVFQHYLQKREVESSVKNANFSCSSFFVEQNEIVLDLVCEMPFTVPLLSQQSVKMHYKIQVNAWVNGVGIPSEQNTDIWEMDNFSRGRWIRKHFGGNLPDNFPVIAKFQNGTATMIKSVDFRKKTYQTPGPLSSNIITMLKTLFAYEGQVLPYGKEQVVILPTEIVKKELLLVIPNAEQSEQTKRELQEATQWARAHSIVFTIQKL